MGESRERQEPLLPGGSGTRFLSKPMNLTGFWTGLLLHSHARSRRSEMTRIVKDIEFVAPATAPAAK